MKYSKSAIYPLKGYNEILSISSETFKNRKCLIDDLFGDLLEYNEKTRSINLKIIMKTPNEIYDMIDKATNKHAGMLDWGEQGDLLKINKIIEDTKEFSNKWII